MIAWIALFFSLLALFFHFRQIIRADCGKLGSLIRICVEDAAGEHIAEIKKTAANGELLKHPDTLRAEKAERFIKHLISEGIISPDKARSFERD